MRSLRNINLPPGLRPKQDKLIACGPDIRPIKSQGACFPIKAMVLEKIRAKSLRHCKYFLRRPVPTWDSTQGSPEVSKSCKSHSLNDKRYGSGLLQAPQFEIESVPQSVGATSARRRGPAAPPKLVLILLALALPAGCGYQTPAGISKNLSFSISVDQANVNSAPIGGNAIDTNCAGCNAIDSKGSPVEQFTATFFNGVKAPLVWSVSGGDVVAGPGRISAAGQYTPPTFLTQDLVRVMVTASLPSDPDIRSSAILRVTPGFLQPLTPINTVVGANGSVNITGYLSEAGGDLSINYKVVDSANGSVTGMGTLGETTCKHSDQVFTSCSVTYYAPPSMNSTAVTYVVARVGSSAARATTRVLLNNGGVSSNPTTHQGLAPLPLQMGGSGGNNNDYDLSRNQIVDCCSGTLGALLNGSDNKRYILSNNHVLARSDQASVGDTVIGPGLIDNNCTPNGDGPGTLPVGYLTGWLPLSSSATNADAAIAQVIPGSVDPAGSILEMGVKQEDGTLAAAPPGISSSSGRGEDATLRLRVAKSGRTTGQTCGKIAAIDLDVSVDYFADCAETKPYLTKSFTNQIAISGNAFSDAGDSGALVVDTTNAEPVGLLFAGGVDAYGVSEAVANPASDVLSELSAQVGGGISYTFAGTSDHAVSCLSYGDNTIEEAQARALPDAEWERVQQSLMQARSLVNPAIGILGVANGKSNDRPGEGAVIVYVDESKDVKVPLSVSGIRTTVIATNSHALASGTAPLGNSNSLLPPVTASLLSRAITIKRQYAPAMMKMNPALFAIGVGQSLDAPQEAALVIFVDRRQVPTSLPQSVLGIRTRYILMDRFHVTRSYAESGQSGRHCKVHRRGAN